jgi:hemerythrin HHE cation binding domain-containing protein
MNATAKFPTPQSITAEHEELHADLRALTRLPGRVGIVARDVADALHPHFVKEEAYALPPLGLLAAVARGELPGGTAEVLDMTDRLREELPDMLAEHRAVVGLLDRLTEAAAAERRPEAARFAAGLKRHARAEEEVLYPAALLLGAYLRLRLGARAT